MTFRKSASRMWNLPSNANTATWLVGAGYEANVFGWSLSRCTFWLFGFHILPFWYSPFFFWVLAYVCLKSLQEKASCAYQSEHRWAPRGEVSVGNTAAASFTSAQQGAAERTPPRSVGPYPTPHPQPRLWSDGLDLTDLLWMGFLF